MATTPMSRARSIQALSRSMLRTVSYLVRSNFSARAPSTRARASACGESGEYAAPSPLPLRERSVGCAGRVTQFAETGDGRFLLTLTGIARYRILDEISAVTAYRQCRVDFSPFEGDFLPHSGEEAVDRDGVLTALGNFAEANQLQIDWKNVRETPNEALVNALSMMSPYGPREKQALLEAPDLRTRADVLIAITEITLARSNAPRPLQ